MRTSFKSSRLRWLLVLGVVFCFATASVPEAHASTSHRTAYVASGDDDFSFTDFWDMLALQRKVGSRRRSCRFDNSYQVKGLNHSERSFDMKCSIRIPDDLGKRVSDTCQTRNITTSELIRCALEAYLGDGGEGKLIMKQTELEELACRIALREAKAWLRNGGVHIELASALEG